MCRTTNILYADPTGADGDGPKDQLVHMLTQSIGTLSGEYHFAVTYTKLAMLALCWGSLLTSVTLVQ